MNGAGPDNSQQDFSDLTGELHRLAEAIDCQEYPGSAWPVRRRSRRRLVLWVFGATGAAAATAAAAAVLVAVTLSYVNGPAANDLPSVPAPQAQAAETAQEPTWSVPTGVDLSVAGQMSLRVPSASVCQESLAEAFEWRMPSISFPSLGERSNDHDS